MDVNSVFNNSFANVDGIAVALSRPKKRLNQQHVGVLYKDTNNTTQLLHQAWHCDLRKEPPNDKYIWLDVPLDPINKIHLATVCEMIFQANKSGIPYGLCVDGTGFAIDGSFDANDHNDGLTCATFVIQVFHSQGIIIIDLDGWKHRKADKKWQNQILQNLKAYPTTTDAFIEHQKSKILAGSARFKPEEVAAAASKPVPPPHTPESIQKEASQLLNIVIKHTSALSTVKTTHV